MSKSWKFGVAGLVGVAAVAVGAVTMTQSASARPVVTVYKTPT